ncbi:WYL domain-containing protein [Methylococcus geothermalis]|nr:WYL domain-containing protein [Methylococcus geothermalis]
MTTSGTVTPPARLKVQLLFDAETAVHLEESPLSEDRRSERQTDGRVLFRATVANTQRLRWWLLGFGDRVEVLGPPVLREEIARTLSNAVQRYHAEDGRLQLLSGLRQGALARHAGQGAVEGGEQLIEQGLQAAFEGTQQIRRPGPER